MTQPPAVHLGVLGYPLGHSLSGVFQPLYLAAANLQGDYSKLEIAPDALSNWVAAEKQAPHLAGFNVTIPYKVRLLPELAECSEAVRLIGAVNTVCVTSTGWMGHNTDVDGFMAPLSSERLAAIAQGEVLIVGAGGAARAVAYGLLKVVPRRITFWVRSLDRSQETREGIDKMVRTLTEGQTQVVWTETLTPEVLGNASLVVNTSPVGMAPNSQESPLSSEAIAALPQTALVYDLVYNPLETRLLSLSRQRGLAVQEGLTMLLYQGARAFEHWTGVTLPNQVMASAQQTVLSHLGFPA